ncbi:MAG: ribosome maturation factor RimP [Actinomycetes bacterium]
MTASVRVLSAGLLAPLAGKGVDLEGIAVKQAGRREIVRIIVDKDGGIDLDEIAEISRLVSELLEAEPLAREFSDTFVLEVSSPGVDRPLTEPKHWRRAVSRKVELVRTDGTTNRGRITSASDAEVVLILDSHEVIRVPMAEVAHGSMELEFVSNSGVFADGVIDNEDEE